jgi:sigma-B regulation protein RsbQ
MMFAHGFGCDQNMWRHVAGSFADRNRVVLFDHVGAGAADTSAYSTDKYGRLHGYADDVIEICEAQRHRDVIFVGHSVSATIGVLAAVKRPDLFAGLVLICPSPRYSNTDTYSGGFNEADIDELLDLLEINNLDWSSVMAPVVLGPDNLDAQAEWRESVCRADPAIAKEFARATFKSDHRAEFRQVSTPTLVIECSSDNLAPREVGAWVRDAIKGSRLVTVDATGHCPHMTAPADVIRIIRSFNPADHAVRTAA